MGKQFVGRNSIQILLVVAASLACACGGDEEGASRSSLPGVNGPASTDATADTGGSAASTGSASKGGSGGKAGGTGGMGATAGTVATGGMMPGDPPMVKTFYAGDDPARNMVVAGQVCVRLAQIQCAGEAFCCDAPGRDSKACEAAQRDGCATMAFLDKLSLNPVTGFDAARASATFEMLEKLASTCDLTVASYGASSDGLRAMLQGTVAPGGKCDQPTLNTKQEIAAGALASCSSGTTTACLPKSALSGWTCEPRSATGGDCFTDLNCQDGDYCPNAKLEFGKAKCAARKADGMPCATAIECASLFCKGGACVKADQQTAYCVGK